MGYFRDSKGPGRECRRGSGVDGRGTGPVYHETRLSDDSLERFPTIAIPDGVAPLGSVFEGKAAAADTRLGEERFDICVVDLRLQDLRREVRQDKSGTSVWLGACERSPSICCVPSPRPCRRPLRSIRSWAASDSSQAVPLS